MPKKQASPTQAPSTTDHFWHLAVDETGVALTDFEYALMRSYESFVRWVGECMQAVSGLQLSGIESALLNVICMHDRPKTIYELGHLTNRQDMPNLQYGLRKLLRHGLIAKTGSGTKGVYYQCTPEGQNVCMAFARLREKLLLQTTKAWQELIPDTDATLQFLQKMEQTYNVSAREAASFHRTASSAIDMHSTPQTKHLNKKSI